MRSLPVLPVTAPAATLGTTVRDHARLVAAIAIVALVALRIALALTLRVNSDEPQHLHVVWAWTQGLLPYRDVFDNHAPLFQALYAPLLAVLGERADIVPLMRLAVIPWYLLTLWLGWRLARTLFDARIAVIAAAVLALQPTFFSRSVEFRPDDAWAAAWVAAVLVAVSGRLTASRAFAAGLLAGLAAAFSIKSGVLALATAVSIAVTLAVLALRGGAPARAAVIRCGAAAISGALVVPAVIAAAFTVAGAGGAMAYCLFAHNAAPGLGRWANPGLDAWIFPLSLPVVVWLTDFLMRRSQDVARAALRGAVLGSGLFYLTLRASYQPLLDSQDLLPVVPLLAPFVAALLAAAWQLRPATGRIVVGAALAIELALALSDTQPWHDGAREYDRELASLLRLSGPGERVMDDKAESIFRQRPLYWLFENVTNYRIARGWIADDLPLRLAADRVGVGTFEREQGKDRDFVRRNYLEVAPRVDVAGKLLGPARAGERIEFNLSVPNRYAVVARRGSPAGLLDGTPYTAPRELGAGPHSFVPDHAGDWAVEWQRAAVLGYSPFWRDEPRAP